MFSTPEPLPCFWQFWLITMTETEHKHRLRLVDLTTSPEPEPELGQAPFSISLRKFRYVSHLVSRRFWISRKQNLHELRTHRNSVTLFGSFLSWRFLWIKFLYSRSINIWLCNIYENFKKSVTLEWKTTLIGDHSK